MTPPSNNDLSEIDVEGYGRIEKNDSHLKPAPNLLMTKHDAIAKQNLSPSVSYESQQSVISVSTVSSEEGSHRSWPYSHYASSMFMVLEFGRK
uniref:Uncharacterized protein n=1 Tax=Panagrolaimus superbus TaxID=310955 RepID=A0A914YKK1_9BILA